MTKITYNVHTDDNGLLEQVKKLSPPTILVMENYNLAHQIAVDNPNTQVIYRPYFPQSDAYHKIMSPNQFVAKMRQRWQGEPNIWFHTGNEAGLGRDLVEWEMALLASPVGMKFVVGNPATGTTPDSVEGWLYLRDYITFLVDHKDKFWLGLHEYFDIIPCITMPNFASRVHDWNGATRPAWQCGRFQWLLDFCNQYLGGQYPNIVLTEFGNDDLRENRDNSPVNALIDMARKNPEYYRIRGWKTLQDQWQEWYKKAADLTYFEMMEWLETNVYNHPAIKGLCVFLWTRGGTDWDQFNVAYADEFNKALLSRANPSNAARQLVILTNDRVNVRASYSTATKALAQMRIGSMLYVYAVPVNDGKYMWYKVEFNGITGYVRSDVLAFSMGYKFTADYGLNIREFGTVDSKVLGILRKGDTFTIIDKQNGWMKIVSKNVVGWVFEVLLTYS